MLGKVSRTGWFRPAADPAGAGAGLQFDLSARRWPILTVSLLIGTPALSGIGAIGAALTLGVRGGGVLLSLLVLPLYIPVLIFGAGAVDATQAEPARRRISLLAALTLGGVFLPVADRGGIADSLLWNDAMSDRLIQLVPLRQPAGLLSAGRRDDPLVLGAGRAVRHRRLYRRFLVAPTDAQQGEGYRIIFLHVPASWMSMFIYLVMAFWAGLGLAFNFRLSG